MFPAKAGIALATPWQAHTGITIGVDPDRAGSRLLDETLHASHVAAPDAGGQAIGGAVGDPQGVGFIAELDDADHRPKNLLLRDPHLMFDVGEHRRADEVSTIADTLTAGHERGALLLADIDIVEN